MALENAGISVFRFDFSGNDFWVSNYSLTKPEEESQGLFQFGYYREVEDIRTVTEYFGAEKHVILAILGHCKGGNVVPIYAYKYQHIDAVVKVSGRYHLDRGLDKLLGGADFEERIKKHGNIDLPKAATGGIKRVTEESLTVRLNVKCKKFAPVDKSCRVLTIHWSADVFVELGDAKEFDKIIPNHRLKIIEGANHGYTTHQDKLAEAIVNYMQELISAVRKINDV